MKIKTEKTKRRAAIFDIDGTIFRSSLLIEFTEALIAAGIFSKEVRRIYVRAHERWSDRQGSYDDYLAAVIAAFIKNIKGVRHRDFSRVARQVIAARKDKVYRYTRDLARELRRKNYYLLAISNSPRELVEAFGKTLGFDKVYGRIYEADRRGRLTGAVLFADLISDKAKILARAAAKENLTLKGSVGVGDSESDIAFLKMVESPICFNPNRVLYRQAKRRGWKVVVERKDVVYHL